MITKKQIQLIKSLHLKKFRKKESLFMVEGAKSVLELLQSDYQTRTVYASPLFLQDNANQLGKANAGLVEVDVQTLASLGTFKSNDAALAVAEMKPNNAIRAGEGEFAIMLDDINDPGNLGTIIRVADWFGIRKLICSTPTVDFYNPKVIAAAKGSFTRVEAFYTELIPFLQENRLPVYGAYMEGVNVHHYRFPREGYLLMGNEANGISPLLESFIKEKISVPGWGATESLNVAIATAIVCDNLRRSQGAPS